MARGCYRLTQFRELCGRAWSALGGGEEGGSGMVGLMRIFPKGSERGSEGRGSAGEGVSAAGGVAATFVRELLQRARHVAVEGREGREAR